MSDKPNLTLYSNYFSIIFWIVNSGLYIIGFSKGKVGITCTAIACLIAHLFYKKHQRLMDNREQWKLALHSVSAILYNAWLPLLLIYFLVLDKAQQKLFVSLFHVKVLPTAFISIAIVSAVALFATWVGFKGYNYLLKRDLNR